MKTTFNQFTRLLLLIPFLLMGCASTDAESGNGTEVPLLSEVMVAIVATPTHTPIPSPTPVPKFAYLTFDDGPDTQGITIEISAKLRDVGAPSTFFFNGADPANLYDSTSPDALQRIYLTNAQGVPIVNIVQQDGHAIGIHGWRHDHFWDPHPDSGYTDIKRLEDALQGILHVPDLPDHLLRAPGGAWPYDPERGIEVNVSGYAHWYHYGWTADAKDSVGTPAETVTLNVLNELSSRGWPNHAILLFHATNFGTRDAFVAGDILQRLRAEGGYTHFRSLPRPFDPVGQVIHEN